MSKVLLKRAFHVVIAFVISAMAFNAIAKEDETTPYAEKKIDYPVPDNVLGWIDSRHVESLNGDWHVIVDPMELGGPGGYVNYIGNVRNDDGATLVEYDFDNADIVRVPGDFNSQQERLFFYRGVIWYYKKITKPTLAKDEKLHLWFGGANFTSQVFLNGQTVGQQIGGYVPFSFDVTDSMHDGENILIVRVSNELDSESVPTKNTDWWPYGGLIRDVALVKTPAAFIRNAKVSLAKGAYDKLAIEVEASGIDSGAATITIAELGVKVKAKFDSEGKAKVSVKAKPELWSPDNPKLYQVTITAESDSISDQIGFRHIETRGTEIVLNGEAIKFKGISTHEEPIGEAGVAYSQAHVERLLAEAKALGVNFVRAAHYPYSRHMAKAADKMGVMLWEEVPVYWNISWKNPETLAIARDQVERLVQRDWNRSSVVVWSVANETPFSDARMAFLSTLIDDVRRLDNTRLVSAALVDDGRSFGQVAKHIAAKGVVDPSTSEKARAKFKAYLAKQTGDIPSAEDQYHLVIDDPLGELTDIVSFNEYFGWYVTGPIHAILGVSQADVRPLMLQHIADMSISSAYDKPLHISEFGAGAKAGNKGKGPVIWSEEYQAKVYQAQTAMLSHSPQVQGMTPWVLKDFRSMMRPLSGIQDNYNRKGLISENGERKQAFYVLRDFYQNTWQ